MSDQPKSEQQWKEQLSDTEFAICRQKGTERAFTGQYWDCKKTGKYHCKCCDEPLFDSHDKYDSGSGWPSFHQPINGDCVIEESDSSLGMVRTEAMCQSCGAHLGHVFEDGPSETGLRYCVNSASLKLNETDV